ncbi:MAG TPA: endonuclease/exonuclease/phosphatase family protein [Verrucomicrobiae bacterium]|nr:endonuclease/exonuclease/phosphatase family protein [Verrucomicrobiae bacterium]
MLAQIEHFIRRLRRRVSRSEWAIPLLGLSVSEGTGMEPGLVLIQIDGLSRRQMERAMERGRLPFLQRLLEQEHYEAKTFYPGIPATTPAVQAELHYGECCAVPAFSYFERATKRVFTMFTPDCAKEVEAELQSHCEGLLKGGSSWSNIYSGGAAEAETHFCTAGLGARDLFRKRPLVRALTFPIFHLPSLIKMIGLLGLELVIALGDLFRGVAEGESVVEEIKLVVKRVFICIGLRELLMIGAKIDTARGLPIIHINFLGYDEQSHRRGPSSRFAHWSLAGIDRAIKNIYRSAHRSARRDYQVWIFSDHGQEATQAFEKVRGVALTEIVREALNGAEPSKTGVKRVGPGSPLRFTGERMSARTTARLRNEMLAAYSEQPFTIAAFGPVGHLYIKEPISWERKRDVALRLVNHGRVPGVLVCDGNNQVEWFHANGRVSLPGELPEGLSHPPTLRQQLGGDLMRLCQHRCAGDLILLGWGPNTPPVSFADERGSHAGPGTEETQGFVLLPGLTRLPSGVEDMLRPSTLRAAIRHYLGRELIPRAEATYVRPTEKALCVMTYNVHGCLGMDGRISPRRVASVIGRYNPDFVALQELDLGRVRSQHHDQPKIIAQELGMHLAFCPTVVAGGEQFGHALLSRFPIRVIRTDILRSGKQPAYVQPRGALWVQLDVDGTKLNVMNTHFGLRRSERREQAADLLDRQWIGSIPREEPLILCGDFNMFPRSEPYRALTRRLRDVQGEVMEFTPLNTFSTLRPMVRIDHIFVSQHFKPTRVRVPRTHLTRVASDHLPLIVELTFSGSNGKGH